jgi:hypothetical protein
MYQVEAVSGWRLGTHFGFQPREPEPEADAQMAVTRHLK